MKRIYVASSWRNTHQQQVVNVLRSRGHLVYDFRNPAPGNHGFHWSAIDPNWETWDPRAFRAALEHPVAVAGYGFDFDAMNWADTCVLVLPCGRSAHLEAGWFAGSGKALHVLTSGAEEPELMYRMATSICVDINELLARLCPAARR